MWSWRARRSVGSGAPSKKISFSDLLQSADANAGRSFLRLHGGPKGRRRPVKVRIKSITASSERANTGSADDVRKWALPVDLSIAQEGGRDVRKAQDDENGDRRGETGRVGRPTDEPDPSTSEPAGLCCRAMAKITDDSWCEEMMSESGRNAPGRPAQIRLPVADARRSEPVRAV